MTTASIDGAPEYAHCVRFRGLPAPVHIGDVVLLRIRDDLLATPAQVLLFADATAAKMDAPQPWIAYRLGVFAALLDTPDLWSADNNRAVLLTDQILVRKLGDQAGTPLARLDLVHGAAVVRSRSPAPLLCCQSQLGTNSADALPAQRTL